eukprot:COSAG05_NODE_14059_length_409_cov_1.074194_1_plen_99_part_01
MKDLNLPVLLRQGATPAEETCTNLFPNPFTALPRSNVGILTHSLARCYERVAHAGESAHYGPHVQFSVFVPVLQIVLYLLVCAYRAEARVEGETRVRAT